LLVQILGNIIVSSLIYMAKNNSIPLPEEYSLLKAELEKHCGSSRSTVIQLMFCLLSGFVGSIPRSEGRPSTT